MFGIDLGDPGVMMRRWHWLRRRIISLLDAAPTYTPDGRTIMGTRLGRALYPTPPPNQQKTESN